MTGRPFPARPYDRFIPAPTAAWNGIRETFGNAFGSAFQGVRVRGSTGILRLVSGRQRKMFSDAGPEGRPRGRASPSATGGRSPDPAAGRAGPDRPAARRISI